MEENKNNQVKTVAENAQQGGQNGGGAHGGRHRRRKHKNGNGGQAQNQAQAQNQGQNAQQNGQNAVRDSQNQAQAQNQAQNQNGNGNQGNKKNKNKQKQKNQNNQNNAKDSNKQNSKNNANKQEENRKDTYVYTLDGNLYINLTNKCSNACDFCVRNERTSYYGNYLWLRQGDPTVEKVIAAANGFGDLSRFKEVVFCGFGEPTYKVAEIVALCDHFHEKGLKTRLNTNGQGNLINKRDITPDLKNKIDFVNISLNASCVEKYQPICRSQYGEAGFAGMIDFAKLCRKNGIACRFSIVDCIGEDEVEACKRLAESIRIPLYVRKYITDS